jgi:hypothetical protein
VAITEDERHELHQGLIEVLGRGRAKTLMEYLPPVGWADVATKRDLDHQSAVTRRDLEVATGRLNQDMTSGFRSVRQEMSTGLADVRQEMSTGLADVRQEMTAGLADVRQEMTAGLADVRQEIAAVEVRLERGLREQSRTFFIGMLAANTTLAALAFTAAHVT